MAHTHLSRLHMWLWMELTPRSHWRPGSILLFHSSRLFTLHITLFRPWNVLVLGPSDLPEREEGFEWGI